MSKQSIAPGCIITFGIYPQTAYGIDCTPIEWLVLDVQDGNALLLSRYGLDAKPFNAVNVNATWATCTLRTWLNDAFLHYAFKSQERMRIVCSQVSNADNQGYSKWKPSGRYDTVDKIFLLNYREANAYLSVNLSTGSSSDTPQAVVHPTRYAILQGAIEDEEVFANAGGRGGRFLVASLLWKQSAIGSQRVHRRQSGSPARQLKLPVCSPRFVDGFVY